MTRLRSTPRPGRQEEQEPAESQDHGEADEHGLARGQEVDRADAAPACPQQEDEGEAEVHEQAGQLLQADAGRGHREVEALLLQKAHVDGDATHARRHDAVDERAGELRGKGAGERDAAGYGAQEPKSWRRRK